MSLSIELLKIIRSDQSAMSLSRELGFKSNQVHRWERGHASFTWHDLLLLTYTKKTYDEDLFYNSTLFTGDINSVKDIVNHFMDKQSRESFLSSKNIQKQRFNKWIKNESSPNADIVLEIFLFSRVSLKNITQSLVTGYDIPDDLFEAFSTETKVTNYYKICPWLSSLYTYITNSDKMNLHDLSENIMKVFGFSMNYIQTTVLDLELAGFLTRDENECILLNFNMMDSQIPLNKEKELLINIIESWTKYTLDICKSNVEYPKDHFRLGYKDIIIPESAKDEVLSVWFDAYKKIQEIQDKYKNHKPERTYVYVSAMTRVDNDKINSYFQN
jgi:hypothetical protein